MFLSTNKEKVIQLEYNEFVHVFNPSCLKVRLVYEIFCILVCLSVFIVEELQQAWYWYFILYSYWSVSISFITFVIAAISTSGKLYGASNKYLTDKTYVWWLNIIDTIRDAWIVLSLIQTAISSLAFWLFTKPSWSIGYPSIVAHTVIVFLLLLLFLVTFVDISWWGLILSLFYAGSYYCFTLMYYLVYRYWAYTLEDPSYTTRWWLLAVISTILQFIFYFLIILVDYCKHHVYFWLYQKYTPTVVYEILIFATKKKEYLKSEILLALLVISFIEVYSGIIAIISIYMVINQAFTVLVLHIIFECFICVIALGILFVSCEYVFYNGDEHSLTNTKHLTITLFVIYVLRILFSSVMLFFFVNTDLFWIYCSIIMMTSMLLLTLIILFYYLSLSDNFTQDYDPIVFFG